MGDKSRINRVSVEFTYDLADDYLLQTNTLKKTATWTYTGPDKLWIFVDNTTNKIKSRFHYTEADDGEHVPTPEGETKVLVDADVNPLLASLIHNELDYGTLPHVPETMPDGSVYSVPNPIPPDHTYELEEIEWDPVTEKFKTPYPWKQPHMDWEEMTTWRNGELAATDQVYNQATGALKEAWATYRQWLRDLPDTHAGHGAWKVVPPVRPDFQPPQ